MNLKTFIPAFKVSLSALFICTAFVSCTGWDDYLGADNSPYSNLLSPVIDPPGGYQDESISVSISSIPGASIWYTLDGSDPSPGYGLPYSGPVNIDNPVIIKAMAEHPDYFASDISEARFIFKATSFKVTIRDFRGYDETGSGDGYINGRGHPDFQNSSLFGSSAAVTGLLESRLSDTWLPVLKDRQNSITSEESFSHWFRDMPGINITIIKELDFEESDGYRSYIGFPFFPIDNRGFGNSPGYSNNFHFTTTAVLHFIYKGDETFTVAGDDDIWFFINGHLAIDLGGMRPRKEGSIILNELRAEELELVADEIYPIHIYHAERGRTGSCFEFSTIALLVELPAND